MLCANSEQVIPVVSGVFTIVYVFIELADAAGNHYFVKTGANMQFDLATVL